MVKPQISNSNTAVLRISMRVLLLFGLCAMAYVVLQSCSLPKQDLQRFSKGSLNKLQILDPAPVQPNLQFMGPEGEEVSLKDFRGQYVLLNVWGTWCPPCVAEIPSLDALQASFGTGLEGRNMEVVAVAMERHRLDAEVFYKTVGVKNLKLYSDESFSMAGAVGVKGLPISIFYDPAGHEIARIPGEVDWQSEAVQEFLNHILD